MKIIVGLGNPGRKFKKTRHNLGFLILDEIRKKWNFEIFREIKKFLAKISKGKFKDEEIILVKPQTFMNNSGKAIKLLISHFNIPLSSLWIIHDDLEIPLGKIKISLNKGSAGHKGVQSIIDELETKNFLRFRVGIKLPDFPSQIKKETFVLQNFSKKEEEILKKVFEIILKAIEETLEKGVERAMSNFNKKKLRAARVVI